MRTDKLFRMPGLPIVAAAISFSLVFTSCEPSIDPEDEEVPPAVLSYGEPGDGLSISFDLKDIHFTIDGYIPEDFELEAPAHGMEIASIARTSLTEGVLSVKPSEGDGEHRVSVLAYNGTDFLCEHLIFDGAAVSRRDTVCFEVAAAGGNIVLDWLEQEGYSVSIPDGAPPG